MITISLVVAVAAALRGMWSPCGLSMLTSLNPVAERARGHRFAVTAGWYVAGAVAGGALLGVPCALLNRGYLALGAPAAVCWALIAAAAVLGVVSDSGALAWHLPEHPRQVDERWLTTYRRWLYAGGYGLQIGTGFATYIMTGGVYLTAVLAVLADSPGRAFAVCVAFGAVRGLVIVVCAGARTPARLRSLLARVDALDATSLRVLGAVQAGVAVWAVRGLGAAWWVAVAVAAGLLTLAAVPRRASVCAVPPGPGSAARGDHDVHEAHLLQHGGR